MSAPAAVAISCTLLQPFRMDDVMPEVMPRSMFLLLLGAVLFTGCDASQNVSDQDVYLLPIEELTPMLADDGRDLRLIDVRGNQAYRAGHIPGAVNVPLPDLRAQHPLLGKADAYVVYAGGPMDPLSLAAAKKLIRLRYAPVYDFRGGVELWTADGRELVAGDQPG